MMTDRPENVIGRHPEEVGENRLFDLILPAELSSCICLVQFFNDQYKSNLPYWSKLF